MKKNIMRYAVIDDLRGLSIAAMIFLHTNAYFLTGDRWVFLVWNLLQFAVPVFVFCSAYVFFKKNYKIFSFPGFFNYLKNRLARLLKPYLIFVAVMFILIYLKEPQKINKEFVSAVLLIRGGLDINWLVLLFLYFSILMPLIFYFYKKLGYVFILYSVISWASSLIFLKLGNLINYRPIMWISWSTIIVFAFYFIKHEEERRFFIKGTVLSLILFAASAFYLFLTGHSMSMYDNKYPPNTYQLSYGILAIFIFFEFSKKGVFDYKPIKIFLSFLSANSFSLFFIHYIVIYFFTVFTKHRFNWISFFIGVLVTSVALQSVLNVLQKTIVSLYYKAARQSGYLQARAD